MDPKLLAIFLALAVLLACAALLACVAHFAPTPRIGLFLAIAGAVLAGIVFVVDLVAY
ncbi:hypothetical protein [Amycolatopsis pigmentata]|uniref:Uncharacterized protein n=1 Tax=Amycolatopsis pigmentata TaxID=450801 RepID=A0ABW5G2W1_9PSEU